MRRLACRVDSPAIIPCLKNLILFVGRLLQTRSREAPEEAKFACTRTPVSSCSDRMTKPLLFVEVRAPGLMKRAYQVLGHCPPEHPSFAGC
jgi:hypothetical protein